MNRMNWEKATEDLRKLYRHPHARWWTAGLVLLALVIGTLAVLLSVQDTTPVDEFVENEWKPTMESGDIERYEMLWDKSAEAFDRDFSVARATIRRKSVRVHLQGIRPVTDPADADIYVLRDIPVTFERDGEEVTTHHTIRLSRRGWTRGWKLVAHRITFPEPPQPVVANVPEPQTPSSEEQPPTIELPAGEAPLDTVLKLSQIVEAWRTAWEQEQLDEYMSWYAKEADITRVMVIKGKEYPRKLRTDQLRRHMERLNKKYEKIQVAIRNLEVDGDDAVADVSFLQEYKAWRKPDAKPTYRDLGTKRLKFMIDPKAGNWRIYAETWKIYREVPSLL